MNAMLLECTADEPRTMPSAAFLPEAAETLGDTTPGAFDPLPPLQHPAVLQADADLRVARWVLLLGVLVFVVSAVLSAVFPWGFAPAP